MHEFSTAVSIVETVLKSSQESRAAKVLSIEVEIGALTFLSTEQLQFWIQEGLKRTLGDGAELTLRIIKPVVHCSDCSYRGGLHVEDDPVFHFSFPVFSCPSCGSTNIVFKKGRECRIKKIDILREEEDDA
jgi:hydrogenase nickel incorporation protein HypA/HybF